VTALHATPPATAIATPQTASAMLDRKEVSLCATSSRVSWLKSLLMAKSSQHAIASALQDAFAIVILVLRSDCGQGQA
jgi:hypothetical protein